jgi:predicted nucleic acid-binding protein
MARNGLLKSIAHGNNQQQEKTMSKMAELDYEIQELFIDGHDARSISRIMDIPMTHVLGTLESFGVADNEMTEMLYEDDGA